VQSVEIESNGVVKAMDTIELEILLKLWALLTGHPCLKFNHNKQRHQIEKVCRNYCVWLGGMFYEITKLKTTLQEKPHLS